MRDYRIYYNRSEDPQRWSIDEGTPATEITVLGISIVGVTTRAETSDEGQPRAWFQLHADMQILQGIAHFYRTEDDA